MPRCRQSLGLLTLCIVGLLATSAAAQTASAPKKQPTQQELAQAREHFQAAEAAKRRHDYKTAIDKYLAAYELFPDPEFFFNVAEAYRLAGDGAGSLTYFQRYLELDPDGRGAPAARAAAEELQRSIKGDSGTRHRGEIDTRRLAEADAVWRILEVVPIRNIAEKAPRATPGQDAPTPAPAAPPSSVVNATPAVAPMHATGDALASSDAPDGHRLRVAGLATGGVGVVALAIGVAFGVHAGSINDEAARWEMFHQARFEEGQAAQRNMYIMTGVGAAALLTGGVLYYLGYRANAEADRGGATAVTLVPIVSPGAATLTATGRF